MVEVIQHLEDRVGRMIAELEALRTVKNQLEAENDGLKVTVADHDRLTGELKAAQDRITELEADASDTQLLEAAAAELTAAQARIAELEATSTKAGQFETDLKAANDLMTEISAEKDVLSAERDQLRDELGAARTELEALRCEVRSALGNATEATTALDAVTRERDEAKAELQAATELLSEVDVDKDALTRKFEEEKTSMLAELSSARHRIIELEEWHASVCRQRDEAVGRAEEAAIRMAELAGFETTVNTLREENGLLTERLNESNRRDERMRERLSTLIERIEAAESWLAQVEMAHEPA